MKKFFAVVLALALVFSLASVVLLAVLCGGIALYVGRKANA